MRRRVKKPRPALRLGLEEREVIGYRAVRADRLRVHVEAKLGFWSPQQISRRLIWQGSSGQDEFVAIPNAGCR